MEIKTDIERKVIELPLRKIRAYENNAKIHTEKQIKGIRDSIQKAGYNDFIEVDENYVILAGHGRLQAFYLIDPTGNKEIKVVVCDKLTESEKKAYRIAHNKLNMMTEFDPEKLSNEFYSLEDTDNFNDTGFSAKEITEIWEETNPKQATEDNFEPPKEAKYKITKGEIWQLGEHRLMCGDSTEKSQVDALMGGIKANMVFTDPPYNVDFQGSVQSTGEKSQNSKFGTIKNDKMSESDWNEFINKFLSNFLEFCDGAIYICMSCKELHSITKTFIELGGHWSNYIIWKKNNFTLSRKDYNSKYEPILYGWREGISHYYCGDNSKADIWEIDRTNNNDLHPTMKPIELCSEAIRNSSKQNDIVLDLFGGSGSTLIASEQLNRKCYLMELDEYYCSVIIERWEKLTNKQAIKL